MKHQGLKTFLLIVVALSFLSSCSPFRPPVRTSPAGALPQTFSLYISGPERPERWWEEFKDGELNALIEEALSGSFTLKDALVSEDKKRRHIEALKAEITAAGRALDEARERYLKGIDDYLPVLTQVLKVQALDVDLIKRQAELLIARVGLYPSLGGTWTDKLTPGSGIKAAKPTKTSSNNDAFVKSRSSPPLAGWD